MSTKRIPQQTIETVYGPMVVNDWRNEDDGGGDRTVASLSIAGTVTINGKDYADLSLYLDRPGASWQDARIYEYRYSQTLTVKAQEKLSAELLTHKELAEYFDVLDEAERYRLKLDKAERAFIAEAWATFKDIEPADLADILRWYVEQLDNGKTPSNIYFRR